MQAVRAPSSAAGGEEALVKLANHGIAPGGHQCGHVKRRPNGSAAAPDEALPRSVPLSRPMGHPTRAAICLRASCRVPADPDQRAADDGPTPGTERRRFFWPARRG